MSRPKITRRKRLLIYLNQSEKERVQQASNNTIYRSISEYGRKMILGEPVTVYYRNQSYDHFTEAYIEFKKDLDLILEKGVFSEMDKKWLYTQIKIITDTI